MNVSSPSLRYIVLVSDEPERAKSFYMDVLKFPVLRESDRWTEFGVGSVLLAIRRRERSYDGGSVSSGSVSIQVAFRVEVSDVDRWHRELATKGVRIVEPPTDQAWMHRTLFFRDPDGNLLEFYAEI